MMVVVVSSRTEPDDDVDDVSSLSALDVVEIEQTIVPAFLVVVVGDLVVTVFIIFVCTRRERVISSS